MTRYTPVVLCILDGWGYRPETADNAIALGRTPNWDRFLKTCPHSFIETSGLDVGLPVGQMGNSEVGHMNLGAGRVVMQDLPRIDTAVADGSINSLPALVKAIETLKATGSTCHLMGLVSPGGVHSHQDHMVALAKRVAEAGVPVAVHAFLDGRDTPPNAALRYVKKFEDDLAKIKGEARIVTVSGRYYAMDRDKRWDRVEKAYRVIRRGRGEKADTAISAIEASYANKIMDEFVLPTAIGDYHGMKNGDGLLMANFRADRAREILSALADKDFHGFHRSQPVYLSACVGMVEYSKGHSTYMDVLFQPEDLPNIFGKVLADNRLRQLRIAETEKYAHVTFFFNGGEEKCYPGEERILIPSPKVATYDQQPAMSAHEVTDRLVEVVSDHGCDVAIVNYANGDMVGHTGMLDAAIKAVETVDECLGRLEKAVVEAGGILLITADHGNCELMKDPLDGGPHTAHTAGKVAAILVNAPHEVIGLEDGRLADIAPTLLRLLAIPQPAEMTGHALLVERRQSATA